MRQSITPSTVSLLPTTLRWVAGLPDPADVPEDARILCVGHLGEDAQGEFIIMLAAYMDNTDPDCPCTDCTDPGDPAAPHQIVAPYWTEGGDRLRNAILQRMQYHARIYPPGWVREALDA